MVANDLINLDLTDAKIRQQQGLNAPVLSSNQAGWRGLDFAYHHQPAHEIPVHSHPQQVIAICMKPYAVRFKRAEGWETEYYNCGDAVILPAEQMSPLAQCDQDVEYINLFLDPTILARMIDQWVDGKDAELVPQLKVHDPLIHQIALALKTELEWGSVDSGLYADSMAAALSSHLLWRYSTQRFRIQAHTGGLPNPLLQQAIAYIHDHLDQDIRLADIAAMVHLSPHYFSSLFKQSVGLAPHQYVTQCRLERAKQLLTKPELSITEILGQIGFKSQSHFTRCFRQYTSTTPKAYRDSL
ncbi:MAG: AraC family transcriptional regulator [Leptolyngbya sp. BL-A-14]